MSVFLERMAGHIGRIIACLALGACVACGGGGGGGGVIPPSLVVTFDPSSGDPADRQVRMRSGGVSGSLVTVEVAVGKAETEDLYAFAFDIELSDPSVVQYVSSSAGDALTGAPVLRQAGQEGSRIVVGVSKEGNVSGNPVLVDEAVVVRLQMRVLKEGTTTLTFTGCSGAPGVNPTAEPAVLDSNLNLIGTVHFDASPATIRAAR